MADGLQQVAAGIPLKRIGTVAKVARAVAFLVAEEAGYITGTRLAPPGAPIQAQSCPPVIKA